MNCREQHQKNKSYHTSSQSRHGVYIVMKDDVVSFLFIYSSFERSSYHPMRFNANYIHAQKCTSCNQCISIFLGLSAFYTSVGSRKLILERIHKNQSFRTCFIQRPGSSTTFFSHDEVFNLLAGHSLNHFTGALALAMQRIIMLRPLLDDQ